MTDRELEIIYEDKDLLVCFKKAGISVQTARLGEPDMESLLKNYLREQRPEEGVPYLAVVHRLDQPVQGLVVFARNRAAAASLSAQAADGRMEKTYLAMVRSDKMPGAGSAAAPVLLEDYLLKDGRRNISRVVPAGTKGAKAARLAYTDLTDERERAAGLRLLRIRLLTGRHHQIRVQLSHAGMPIAGDRRYGSREGQTGDTGELMLCACSLSLVHPRTGRRCAWSVEDRILQTWRT